MESFWMAVPKMIPSWLIAFLALLAALEFLALCGYLIRHKDHLILHAADVGLLGVFLLIVFIHYALIVIAPGNFARSIALSRIVWVLFLFADCVIVGRYLWLIVRERVKGAAAHIVTVIR